MRLDELQARLAKFWAQEIPLTRAMQVSLDAWDGECITVSAALDANRNDKGSAFGGSLYSLAVLAGWGAIMLRLWQEGFDCDVVIQRADLEYVSPVRQALVARCCLETSSEWPEFVQALGRKGKARLSLRPTVAGSAGDALRMNASFVAFRRA